MYSTHNEAIAELLKGDLLELQRHPIYRSVKNLKDLQTFMSCHVFAVWDFMSLLKSLQRTVTNISVPWVPSKDPFIARLINEIVLEEESDIDPDGNASSHLELYILAMNEIGAPTEKFELFLKRVRQGDDFKSALDQAEVPTFVSNFVSFSVNTALKADICEVAAAFVFGRETVIPSMFTNLVTNWGISEDSAPAMHYYLKRHIEIDGNEHGPASLKLLDHLIAGDLTKVEQVVNYGQKAIRERINFWTNLNTLLKSRSSSGEGIAA